MNKKENANILLFIFFTNFNINFFLIFIKKITDANIRMNTNNTNIIFIRIISIHSYISIGLSNDER